VGRSRRIVRVSDDRDWAWLHRPQPAAPPAVEQTLWIVEKDGRRAELRVRQHPLGLELRMAVGDRSLWSEVYRPGLGRELGAVADEHKAAWVARGWRIVLQSGGPNPM
jgi:hypothetical protein